MHILKNFKNFDEAELDLMRPLTLLIGRNGSGKSNLIEGVELLSQLAHGRRLHEITDLGRGSGSTFEVRGGIKGCCRNNKDYYFSLGFNGQWKKQDFSYSITIYCYGETQPIVYDEKLYWGDYSIFEATAKSHTSKKLGVIDIEYNNFKPKRNPSKTKLPSDCSVLSRYSSFAKLAISGISAEAYGIVDYVEKWLNTAFVFDLSPRLMRNYERMGQSLLSKDGSNLSSVLYTLSQGNEDQKRTLSRISANLKQLPEEPFGEFEFIKTQVNDVLLALKSTDGRLVDARLLSDGTLRTLAILTALETVPEYSKIIIEEMDNGIHPSRVKMLVDAIWECGKRRNLNVLATTHNPATLNCLSGEQLEAVVLCHYDQEKKSSTLTPLLDLPRADVLLERGGLGDLVTRQVIDQYLAPNFEEKQKQKAKAWLESLS